MKSLNAFSLLGLPAAPQLDESLLAQRFDELSRSQHPDAGGEASAFALLTEARRQLSSPAARWRHLLELQFPDTSLDGALPPSLMDIFATLGPALQKSQDLLRRKTNASSALTRALLTTEAMRHRESLEMTATALADRLDSLQSTAAAWDGTGTTLAAWAREAAFLEKWQAQTRETLWLLAMD